MKSEEMSNYFYGGLGEEGLNYILPKRREKEDLQLIKNICKKSDKILDLGCGYGRLAIPLAKEGYKITGIDILPEYIRKARQKAKEKGLKIVFNIGNITKLPYKANSFNKIVSIWSVFMHLLKKKEQKKAISEIYRVLSPGGVAFIEIANKKSKEYQKLLSKEGKGKGKHILQQYYTREKKGAIAAERYFHDRKSILKICRTSRFEKIRIHFRDLCGRRTGLMVYCSPLAVS